MLWLIGLILSFTVAYVFSFIYDSTVFLASINSICLQYFTSRIAFSLLYILQDLENVGWFSWQYEHLISLGQSSSMWFGSLWQYLPHVGRPLLSISLTYKAPQGWGIYYSILSMQYLIFITSGIIDFSNIRMYVCVCCIFSPPLLKVILL